MVGFEKHKTDRRPLEAVVDASMHLGRLRYMQLMLVMCSDHESVKDFSPRPCNERESEWPITGNRSRSCDPSPMRIIILTDHEWAVTDDPSLVSDRKLPLTDANH